MTNRAAREYEARHFAKLPKEDAQVTALLTDEEIAERGSKVGFNNDAERYRFECGAFYARSVYEARLAEVSQLRDQYQGDLIKVNAALDGHANEIIRLTARLAEAISLMKEAAPAIDTIAFDLSERFDRFLAVYAKEDKP